MTEQKLYENADFGKYTQGYLRPGGVELTEKALSLAQLAQGAAILDVGCGCGTTVAHLQTKYDCQGIDTSQVLVAKGQAQNLPLTLGSVYELPYANHTFAAVTAECVFSLFKQKSQALEEIRRVLGKEGKLLVSDLYIREGEPTCASLPLVTCLNGMGTAEAIQTAFRAADFQLLAWQDETLLFKGFLAGLIMNYGSMADFWQSITGDCGTACLIKEQLKFVKIGYYLAIWQKN